MTSVARAARVVAIAIALVGMLDPTVASMRRGEPEIALIGNGMSDSALVREVRERLEGDFWVVEGPWQKAAATVLVGPLPERLPSGPLYSVASARRIWQFDVPPEVSVNERVDVAFAGAITDAALRRIHLIAGPVVVDTALSGGSDYGVGLAFVPPTTGPMLLEAVLSDAGRTESVQALTNVVDRRHAVLFFDRRPSWTSTFIRRSLERDPRFAVASRVITSRGVSVRVGQAPSTLSDPTLLELYDVIVVGAPTQLTAGDVSGLETFVRRRGGAVVLLFDETPTASPVQRITGVSQWTSRTTREPAQVRGLSGETLLRYGESITPRTMPVGAESRFRSDQPSMVWSRRLGGGEVVVNGALDAWKFRDPGSSAFDEFWRAIIARAAREAQAAVAVEITPNVASPGERLTIRVTMRDSLARPSATLDSTAISLWPTERAGEFTARVRAGAIGTHWVRASAGGARAEEPFMVRDNVNRVRRHDSQAQRALATASGGAMGSIGEIESAVRQRVRGEPRMERWRPMRNGWWILPFVTLLGFEWLVRRRRGLA